MSVEVIEQRAEIIHVSHPQPEQFIELAARTCYRSHERANGVESANRLINQLLSNGHGVPFEMVDVTFRLTTDRATSHQLVRHRHATILQESQRYVRYNSAPIKVIKPVGYDPDQKKWRIWLESMEYAADRYVEMIAHGAKAQQARKVLPNSTATTLIFKANCREWMHILGLRHHPAADAEMQALMEQAHDALALAIPILFEYRNEVPGEVAGEGLVGL